MNKINIIIAREFLTRVRKKSFIIASLLGPIIMGAVLFLPAYFAMNSQGSKSFVVIDESEQMGTLFVSDEDIEYRYVIMSLEEAKRDLRENDADGLIYIPAFNVEDPKGFILYATSNQSLSTISDIERKIDNYIEEIRLEASGLDKAIIDSFKVNIEVSTINLSETGAEQESSSVAATVIVYIASILIYMFVFIYGAMCMRGVIEEKNSRIVEVILSSVKPFELMMGKVIGIAMVGLTQFVLWILLTGAVTMGVSAVMVSDGAEMAQVAAGDNTIQMEPTLIENAFSALGAVNFPLVIGAFLFYFIGGYLLYGALFAAIGSASDSDADAQQFIFPVTAPLIVSIISLSIVLEDPHGSIAFWMSIIPFTSPIIMMMRIPFGVAPWELILSMSMLILGFLFTLWIAGRIYRVGILMHGTKVNWKILAKWFMTSDEM